MIQAVLALAVAATLSLPFAAPAAGQDELWEVSSQMNVPGMPPGMGAATQQVCQDKDPSKQAVQGENMEKCKITDRKQSGNKITMTVTCPDSKAVIEHTYNAARTEYKGSMRMTSRDGDMTMTMSGRKIGACDAQQARRQRESQMAAIQGQVDQQAQAAKQQNDEQIRQCAQAVETMDYARLGVYGQCRQQPELCKAMASNPATKPVVAACNARQAEFCKRYQTEGGFLKAKADPRAAEMCGVSVEQVKGNLCPGAAAKESLPFLGRYCLAEAKPVAEKHCAGRDYTALRAGAGKRDKYDDFCMAYLSNASLAASSRPSRASQSASQPASQPAAAAAPAEQGSNPADAVTEGISQGINKLRGIFGR